MREFGPLKSKPIRLKIADLNLKLLNLKLGHAGLEGKCLSK